MAILIAGLVVFLGVHTFTMFRTPRAALAARLGEEPYKGLYSLISAIGLVLIVWGYGQTPKYILYDAPLWGRHLNLLLMLVALICLAAAYTPTGHIKKTLKHPMLVAVKIWALGHLLANGDLASLLLFGTFLAWAVVDRIAVKKRGEAGPATSPKLSGDLIAVVIGFAAYLAIAFWLHPLLIGVPVLPV